MNEEELKNKCKERAKIFQQAMESCKSSSPMDCIEWFADRIAELEAEVNRLKLNEQLAVNNGKNLLKENEELEKQVVDLKDYVFKVSKFLHNNNNVRPDNLVYKERDVLLIKELKLVEKWELSK